MIVLKSKISKKRFIVDYLRKDRVDQNVLLELENYTYTSYRNCSYYYLFMFIILRKSSQFSFFPSGI
jgi:hypothetical protein